MSARSARGGIVRKRDGEGNHVGYAAFKAALEGLKRTGEDDPNERSNERGIRGAAETALQFLAALPPGSWDKEGLPGNMRLHQNGNTDLSFTTETYWSGGSVAQKAELQVRSHHLQIEGQGGFRCSITFPCRPAGETAYDPEVLGWAVKAWLLALRQRPNPDAEE